MADSTAKGEAGCRICAKPSLLIADYRREQAITRVPLLVVTKPDVVELVGTGGLGLGQ
jgi:hypothetical protein